MHNDTLNTTTDEVLFLQMKQGDEGAFETLFFRYYASLCAYARTFVEEVDGQDIASDVLIWLWESREMHIFEISLKSYLFKSIKNRCLTLINRNEIKHRVELSLFEQKESQYDDPDFYIVDELTRKVEEVLSRLPSNVREAFEMNRFKNLTYQEIANLQGVSPKTVDYRIQQALKQLRLELKEYLPLMFYLLLSN